MPPVEGVAAVNALQTMTSCYRNLLTLQIDSSMIGPNFSLEVVCSQQCAVAAVREGCDDEPAAVAQVLVAVRALGVQHAHQQHLQRMRRQGRL